MVLILSITGRSTARYMIRTLKKKYNKVMEDRKRDGDIAKYENVLALLRNPKSGI